jgi:prepilin-type N-terminal cleavage/methylation domain-containing protein
MKKGFTLIEAAVVLIIIGIVVGGVLQGNEIIHQARIRAQIRQFVDYTRVRQAFEIRYNSLPGDFSKASTYLGPSAVNGNNNNKVDFAEGKYYFQHLALAGLADANYVGGTQSDYTNPGVNVPVGKLPGVCMEFEGGYPADVPIPSDDESRPLQVGKFYNGNEGCSVRTFTSEDAYSIDKKMDDANPAFGVVAAATGLEPDEEAVYSVKCTVTSGNIISYNLAVHNDKTCILFYYLLK